MNNLKRKVSLILSVMMLALAIFPVSLTTASSNTDDVQMSVKLNGKTEMQNAYEYEVKNGDKINISAQSTNGSSIAFIGYYYYDEGVATVKDVAASNLTITVPTQTAGTERVLVVEAVAANNKGKDDPTNRTGWQFYYLKWVADEQKEDVDVNVKYDGKTLADRSTTNTAVPGDKLNLVATPAERVKRIYYQWDSNKINELTTSNGTITIPTFEPGSTHFLYVVARDIDNVDTQQKVYKFIIPEQATISSEVNAKYNGRLLLNGEIVLANPSEKLELSVTDTSRAFVIFYRWDMGTIKEASAPYVLSIPADFKPGSVHMLEVVAYYGNGEYTEQKTYYISIPENITPVNPTDDSLEILPWEEDNKDLDGLAISLRNDSESEKANKNVYSLGEDVTYFVDFRNAGKDITDEVVIKLELPLDFEVVDSANGVVDAENRTITWTYPNGMEEDAEGTKEVVVRYTSFDRKSTDSKVVYPVATISKKDKLVDDSAVINLIYKDDETVITDTHEPYMYGDANATTFRPDATITRAEGALVLTRILLGQDAIDNVKVTSVYPDLGETYLEAQKAIIAATEYELINGYTDGYYRPNQAMTRAEFMKIIAKFIEKDADRNEIDGLRIKELDELVKIYKDPKNKYAVNGQLIDTHWALEEVTLLARLNMTSAADDKNLRMDEGITRAEVAQLVNFYLLRAPAEVTNRTKTQFSDLGSGSRRHKLFADIVEATREAHDYTITEDGTEIAE